jgi:hypothetical protein
MCLFSKWKNILGVPKEGVHRVRLFGLALTDLVLTIILAVLISYWKNWNITVVFLSLIVLSILIHLLFCVDTTLIKLLKKL